MKSSNILPAVFLLISLHFARIVENSSQKRHISRNLNVKQAKKVVSMLSSRNIKKTLSEPRKLMSSLAFAAGSNLISYLVHAFSNKRMEKENRRLKSNLEMQRYLIETRTRSRESECETIYKNIHDMSVKAHELQSILKSRVADFEIYVRSKLQVIKGSS